ncbi:MAG TPA: hypothetical protein DCL77_11235 [Prolixibacteraceae bacterium]|nr:hypothetical protein [Prolixibacteraceae bacterium]
MKTNKHFLLLLVLSVFLLFGTSCKVYRVHTYHKGQVVSTRPNGKVPPGQMKKMTGAQSAKAYAPGQVKKHGRK